MNNFLDLFYMGPTLVDCKDGYVFYQRLPHCVKTIPASGELTASAEAIRSRLPLPKPVVLR